MSGRSDSCGDWRRDGCRSGVIEASVIGDDVADAFGELFCCWRDRFERVDALKWLHFGQTYSFKKSKRKLIPKYYGKKVEQLTSIFPHTLFNKSIVSETFFTDQGIARTWRGNVGIVVAQDRVSESIVPLSSMRLHEERWGSCGNKRRWFNLKQTREGSTHERAVPAELDSQPSRLYSCYSRKVVAAEG